MRTALCLLICVSTATAAPPEKSSLTADAEGKPLPAGMVNLNGSTITKAQFLAKCATMKKGDTVGDFTGRAVKIVGPIAVVAPGRLGFSVSSQFDKKTKAWSEPVTVSLKELGGNFKAGTYNYAAGNVVAVYGIITEKGELSLWDSELLPPGVTWSIKPKVIPTVADSPTQKLEIEFVAKGPQMASVEIAMKLQHPDAKELSNSYKFQPFNAGLANRATFAFDWPKGTTPEIVTKVTAYTP